MQDQDREKSTSFQLTALLASDQPGIGAPIRLFIFIGTSIFVAEIIAMVVVSFLDSLSYVWITLIDAAVMLILIFPFLYHFSFRPLLRHIEMRQQVEEKLRQTNEDMEQRVRTRTAELRSANLELQEEVMVRKQVEENLRSSEERYRGLFNSMTEGFALHQILCDDSGTPFDYRFLEINPSFERLTGLKRDMTVGRTVREILPDLEPVWIEKYGNVALTGQPVHFVEYTASLKKWYEIYCYSPEENYFAVLFFDISERKKAEDQLSYQATLLSTVNDAIIASDSQYRLTAWNSASELLYGWKAEEVLGCNGLEIMRTEWLERDPEQMRRAIAETGRWRGEATQVRRDGSRFPVEVSSIVLHDDKGRIIGYVSVNRDITDRKLAEEALRQSQLDLYRAQEVGQIGSWRLDVRRNVLTWSDENHRMFGIPIGTPMTYETFLSKVHPEDRSYVDEKWDAALNGEAYDIEHRIIVDGKIKWVREKAYLEFDGENNLKGGFGITQDISERKRTAELIERSNQRLNEILASIQDDFYVLDHNWNFSYASRLFTSKVGKEPEDFVGKNIWQMFPKHVGTELEENFRAAMERREVRRFEVGGKYTNAWYRMTAFPSADGITVLGTDITDRRQAEAALQNSEALLRAVLDQMPSGVTVREAVTGKLILSNTRSQEILGDVAENTDQLAKYRGFRADGSPYQYEEWPVFRSMVSGEKVDAEEIEFESGSGTRITISMSSAPIRDMQGEIISGVAVFHDITERKKAEVELQQLNRTLRAHSAANQAVLRARTEAELLNEVCKIVVEDCGHAMVWIGYAEDNEEKSVRPVAHSGFEEGYLETLKITWSDTARGQGPTGTAIRTGKPQSCRNMLTDPLFAPWREQALERGYSSSLVLPLISRDGALGAMTIYSREPDAFAPDEADLLNELALDLTHGIEMIRLRQAHDLTTAALRESEERFRLALSHAPVTVAVQDRGLRYTWAYNQRTRGREEIIGKTDADLFPNEAEHLTALKLRVMETGENASEQLWIDSNNTPLFVDLFMEPLRNERGEIDGIGLASLDLTPLKRAEEQLRLAHDKLELRVKERTAELAAANLELSNEIAERREIERQLRIQTAAMEAAANGIIITDPNGIMLWTNPAMTQISGYSKEELIGHSTKLFNSGKNDENFYRQMWRSILEGKVWQGEITNRRKDGTFYIEEQTITPVQNETGELSHFIAIKQDVTERKSMYAQLEASNQELITLSNSERQQRFLAEGLVESSVVLNMSLELHAVLDRIFEQTRRLIPYSTADVVLIDENVATVVRQWWTEEHAGAKTLAGNQSLKIDEFPLWERICRTQSAIMVPDTRFEEQWNTYFGMQWARSYLGAPLVYDDQVVGIINLISDQANAFQESMLKTLKAFAAPAAVAIQNARLYENEQQNRKVAEILSAASVALAQTLDTQMVMETVLDYMQFIMPLEVAFVILSEGDERYRIRAVRTGNDDAALRAALLDQTIDMLSEPIVRSYFRKYESTFLPDSRELSAWHPPLELASMNCWLGIPLESMGKILGIVVIAHGTPHLFTKGQTQLAEAVVKQAVVALQNAWLFEQVRSGRERLQQLSRHLVEVQENERKYIARELHDETSQSLTSLKMGLQVIEREASRRVRLTEQVRNLQALADETLESLHHLAVNLRPASLDQLGLAEALTSLIESTKQRSGLQAHIKIIGAMPVMTLTEEMETSIYRIVQESITNVLRHANATYVDVILEWLEEKIMIVIEDDGVGMDLQKARENGRLGLIGMQERAEMLGGKLLIDSTPQVGTTLVVEIPYANSHSYRR